MTEYPEIIVELAEAEANVGRLLEALKAILHTYDEGGVPLGRAFKMANAAIAMAENSSKVIPSPELNSTEAIAHSSGIPDAALVEDLELSVRSIAVLKRGGLLTVGDVRSYNDERLKGLGLSKRFLNEVRELIGYCEAKS